MHDLDRAMFETEKPQRGSGSAQTSQQQEFFEILGEIMGEDGGRPGELELAAELLEVRDEAELDRFLGDLLRSAAGAASSFARSDTGKALGGIVKKAAGEALPVVGKAIGARIDPAYAGYGERAGKAAGALFGLELEGLSQEDREFETAKALIRLTNSAAQLARQAPAGTPPPAAATAAAVSAGRKHLPGLDIWALSRMPLNHQSRGATSRSANGKGDRAMTSFTSEWETGDREYESEWENQEGEGFLGDILSKVIGGELESPLSETQETQLAGELMEVSNEEELEQFLGNLMRGAAKAVGGVINSPVGKALGGALKSVAKTALPMAAGALGNLVLPGVGGAIGSKLGSMATKLFELELEGLSEQESEFEVARQYVKFASTAAAKAAQAPKSASPAAVTKTAVMSAAQKHAPGLARAAGGGGPAPARQGGARQPRKRGGGGQYGRSYGNGSGSPAFGFDSDADGDDWGGDSQGSGAGSAQSGRWFRRGRKIVIMGC